MRAIIAISTLLFSSLVSAQTFSYNVTFKGALSGFSWTTLADATLTTKEILSCSGRGSCLNTKVNMTSKGHSLMESIYPTRFFYQSFFQQQPLRTIAFEKREKKSKSNYQPYGYRHKLVTVSKDGTKATYYALWSSGKALSPSDAFFVSTDFNRGKSPYVKSSVTTAIGKNALDRWALIHTARFLPYKAGFSRVFPGTNGTDKLSYRVTMVGNEPVSAKGKTYDAWKVAIVETKAGKKQPTLYLWVSKDKSRIPLRVEMAEKIGKVRFNLK